MSNSNLSNQSKLDLAQDQGTGTVTSQTTYPHRHSQMLTEKKQSQVEIPLKPVEIILCSLNSNPHSDIITSCLFPTTTTSRENPQHTVGSISFDLSSQGV
jgi:hypothetical protein